MRRRLRGFGSAWHLVTRFFGSLLPVGPPPETERWALEHLSAGERLLFSTMSGPDRRHAIGVATEALELARRDGLQEAELPAGFVPAALMHDVGKVQSGLGTFGRVFATLLALVLGRSRVVSWEAGADGWRLAFARYLSHDRLGARSLEQAGADALTVSWAREHHLSPEQWSVDRRLAAFLKAADGD